MFVWALGHLDLHVVNSFGSNQKLKFQLISYSSSSSIENLKIVCTSMMKINLSIPDVASKFAPLVWFVDDLAIPDVVF